MLGDSLERHIDNRLKQLWLRLPVAARARQYEHGSCLQQPIINVGEPKELNSHFLRYGSNRKNEKANYDTFLLLSLATRTSSLFIPPAPSLVFSSFDTAHSTVCIGSIAAFKLIFLFLFLLNTVPTLFLFSFLPTFYGIAIP